MLFKQAFLKQLNKNTLQVLVVGNSSCDLDSVVSSICYSYFYNLYHNTNASHPYLDIRTRDLQLRKDVVFVLLNFGISTTHLFFQDELSLPSGAAAGSHDDGSREMHLALVDHNDVQNPHLAHHKVAHIIDHHLDEHKHLDADPRIVRSCGSCASLVFNYWYDLFRARDSLQPQLSSVFAPVAQLVLSPIIMDTSNLQQKMEDPDWQAVERLRLLLPDSFDIDAYYSQIHSEKLNIDSLSVEDLLLKDYKVLALANGLKIGFSSLAKSFEYILLNNSPSNEQFAADVLQFVESHHLDALVMMTSFEEGTFKRQIGVFVSNSSVAPLVSQLETKLDLSENFQLTPALQIYNQGDVKASRKQVLPLVRSLLE